MEFVRRRSFNFLVGSGGFILIFLYLLAEYIEYGSISVLFTHLTTEMGLAHIFILLLVPIFLILGLMMERRQKIIDLYSNDLKRAVEDRTHELEDTMKRHDSYIFSVADGLRNPLQVFLGNLETIDTSNFSSEQTRAYNDINNAATLLQENIALLTDREGIERAEKIITEAERKGMLYQSFIDRSNDAMYIVDFKGNFTYVNQTAARLMGYKKEELMRMNISEFLYPEGRKAAFMKIARLMAGENIRPHEMVIKTAQGDRVGELSVTLLKEGIKPVGILGIARDITERKEIEEKLRATTELDEKILDASPVAFILHDRDLRIVKVSRAYEEVTGYSADEVMGKRPEEFMPEGKARDSVLVRLRKIMEEGKEVETLDIEAPTREIKFLRETNLPIKDKEGRVTHVLVALENMTLQKKTEEKFKTLFDNSTEGIFLLELVPEAPPIIVEANQSALEMHGYTKEELIGKPITLLDSEEDKSLVAERAKGVMDKGEIRFETAHVRKDGTTLPLEVHTKIVEIGGKKLALSTERDITERKMAEEKLKTEEQKFLALFNSINDHLLVHELGEDGLPGKLIEINDVAARNFGTTREEALGRSMQEIIPTPPEVSRETGKKLLAEGEDTFERPIVHEGGKKGYMEFHSIVFTLDEKPVVVTLGRDITARRRAEERLEDYTEDLEDSNRLKQLFTEILSHDLYNPVGMVESYIDLIRGTEVSKEQEGYLESMESSLQRAMSILDDANIYLRLKASEDLEFNPFKIVSSLKEVIEHNSLSMEKKGITSKFETEREVTLEGNPLLEVAFSNILSNAVKYAPDDTVIEIEVEDGDPLRVRFRDQGPGIPDEDKERVFERFERRYPGPVAGIGLGLAIVKRIVGLHHGKVWVEDNPGGGSVFVIELPKEQPK